MPPEGFKPAPPDIEQTVGRLISAHFANLAGARLLLLARDSALQADGGQFAVAAAGTDPEATEFDYVLWFAWDVWQVLSVVDRDALVFHELTHCDRDEQTGQPIIKEHDAGVFNTELELYGMWWIDAQQRFKALDYPTRGESRE